MGTLTIGSLVGIGSRELSQCKLKDQCTLFRCPENLSEIQCPERLEQNVEQIGQRRIDLAAIIQS